MRKLLTFIAGSLVSGSLLAGGLVTNTNQSASWVRLPSRNASTEVDAAYFNPAGLMKLDNGFHISLSNQTIFQSREIGNSYKGPLGLFGLNDPIYKGNVSAPLFPSIFAVYKMDKLAFSVGFVPVGGGGGAEFDKGLPSFEMSASDLVPSLASAPYNATGYRLNVYFKGSSIFLGYQGAISYKINDLISVAAGARYVTAKNTYKGYLKDIEVNLASGWTRADLIMAGIAGSAADGGDGLQGIIDLGAGGFTADQLVGAGQMTVPQRDAIVNGLTSLGVNNAASLTISQSQTAFYTSEAKYNATATLLHDQEADATQTGSGVTPFFSVDISPNDKLNIAVKYEMATKLELVNKTKKDFLTGYTALGAPITEFPDGEKVRNDMPAMLTVGINYKLSSNLKVALGGDYFFDKSADYGHMIDADLNPQTPPTHIANSEIIANNGMSVHGGLEYNISDNFLVSGGYIWSNKGVNDLYQSDLTYGLATQTFGAGGAYCITDKIKLNLGASYTLYTDGTSTVDHIFSATGSNIPSTQTYKKNTFLFGIGLDLSF
jgi:long-chain fatty acid transport protein